MLPLFPIVLLALQTVEMPSVQTDFLYDVQMVDVIFTWSMAGSLPFLITSAPMLAAFMVLLLHYSIKKEKNPGQENNPET